MVRSAPADSDNMSGRWEAADDDEKLRKALLLPIAGAAWLSFVTLGVLDLIEEEWFDATLDLVASMIVVLFLARAYVRQRFSQSGVEAVVVLGGFMLAIVGDVSTFGERNRWALSILVGDLLLLTGSRIAYKLLWLGVFLVYMTVRYFEQTHQFGLWDLLNWQDKDLPEKLEGRAALGQLVNGVTVFCWDYAITRRWATQLRKQQVEISEGVLIAEEVALALVRFDLDTAKKLTKDQEDDSDGEVPSSKAASRDLLSALRALLTNLEIYRPYLPEAVLLGEAPGSPIYRTHSSLMSPSVGRLRSPSDFGGSPMNRNVSPAFVPLRRLTLSGSAGRYRTGSLPGALSDDKSLVDEMTELAEEAERPSLGGAAGAAAANNTTGQTRRRKNSLDAQRTLEQGRLRKQLDLGVRERSGSVLCGRVGVSAADARFDADVYRVASDACAACIDAVQKHSGIASWVAADTVLASWNCHRPTTRHALRAAHAALDLCAKLRDMSVEPPRGFQCVCATSLLLHGHMGTDSLRVPYVLGYAVTQARQLGSVARHLQLEIVVTEAVRERIRAQFHARPVDVVSAEPTESNDSPFLSEHPPLVVYELIQEKNPDMHAELAPPLSRRWVDINSAHERTYAEGFALFRAAKMEEAEKKLREALTAVDGTHQLQTLRVLRLVALSLSDDSKVPAPYRRRFLGWADYEKDAACIAIGAEAESVENLAKTRAGINQVCSPLSTDNSTPRARNSTHGGPQAGPASGSWRSRRSSQQSVPSPLSPLGAQSPSVRREDEALRWELNRRMSIQIADLSQMTASSSQAHGMLGVVGSALKPAGATTPNGASPRRRVSVTETVETGGTEPCLGVTMSRTTGLDKTGTTSESPQLQQTTNTVGASSEEGSFEEEKGPLSFIDGNAGQSNRCGSGAALRAMPKTFEDTSGMSWHCSGRRLGRGAYGDVWLGMDEDGALVALKAVRIPGDDMMRTVGSDNATDRGVMGEIEALLREVALLSELRHENVVAYNSSAVSNTTGHVIVIMEYVPGGSLQGVVESFGMLPLTSVTRYVRDILRGLQFLHGHDVAHRDLKPGNVLLGVEGQCKLADFGASVCLSNVQPLDGIAGTPQYMAPEACRGEASLQSDIWALGITVCFMLTGESPFEDMPQEPQAFVYKLAHDPLAIPAVPRNIAEHAANFVCCCVRRDQSCRSSASQLLMDPLLI
eukprot:TRINITY_DN3896_c0_g1_i1.p1 TRINITY_DN3896_c0_g1~~TRINITY_DN3896_c0_g1_i1.p1  ORF type:complete len:1200 (+),score=301.30 TRINITY_DN3896_c0_g1_i1:98-3697(+)